MNKNTILWIVGGLSASVGGYFLYKKITNPTITFGEELKKDIDKGGVPMPKDKTTDNVAIPLKRGSKGARVVSLQKFLVSEGYDIGAFGSKGDGVDGDFGRMTEKAVTENQQPFNVFKSMYPSAVSGQVSVEFYNTNIKGRF